MKRYKLQIVRIEKVPDKFGNNILIKQVKVMDENGKYIKFAKLNDTLIEVLKNAVIDVEQ
jgi:hypothetical protein